MGRRAAKEETAHWAASTDFLTDFWKTRKGIVGLPRRYNCQLHQIALLGPGAPEDSVYWAMASHHTQEGARQGEGQEEEFDRAGPSADRACGTMEAQSLGGFPTGGDEQQVGEVKGCGSHRGAPSGDQPDPARGHTYVDAVLAAYGVAEHRGDGERRNPTP